MYGFISRYVEAAEDVAQNVLDLLEDRLDIGGGEVVVCHDRSEKLRVPYSFEDRVITMVRST